MVELYYNLIKAGYKTIDNVPPLWRDAVRIMLESDATA